MPKAPDSPTIKVKPEPYEKPSPKVPKKQRAAPANSKGTWTEEMNRDMISHVLSISEIKLRYNWADLQKNKFPHLTVKQLENHWNYKVKGLLFPPDLIKMSKQAKEAENKGRAGSGD